MALIKCEECGHMVSDRAEACPNCGAPTTKPSVCSECGAQLPGNAATCPNCGCPTEKKNNGSVVRTTTNDGSQPQQKSKATIPCIIALVAYGILSVLAQSEFVPEGGRYQGHLEAICWHIMIGYSCCALVFLFLTPSLRDYFVCMAINCFCGVAGYNMLHSASAGNIVFLIYAPHFVETIILAIRRSNAMNFHKNDNFLTLALWMRIVYGAGIFILQIVIMQMMYLNVWRPWLE